MIFFRQRLFFFFVMLFAGSVAHPADDDETPQLYFGIEHGRLPYSDFTNGVEAKGILVNALRDICQEIIADCNFVGGESGELLELLKSAKIDAVMVIDSILLPDVDQVRLTSPLCRIQPLFMQRTLSPTAERLVNRSTIAVQQDSVLHLHLLDEYGGRAMIAPYPMLEGALFDLSFGLVDALFIDEAFFKSHESLTKKTVPILATIPTEDIELLPGAMSLAVNPNNKKYNLLEQAIETLFGDELSNCADLVDDPYELPELPQTKKTSSTH